MACEDLVALNRMSYLVINILFFPLSLCLAPKRVVIPRSRFCVLKFNTLHESSRLFRAVAIVSRQDVSKVAFQVLQKAAHLWRMVTLHMCL